ncbi:MAG: hypothetical protein A2464_08880 [Deltaproteobacteria bacterium RIFOXYC2_FULL_48_10]|nr:MAG: hypothetical protein A2464_08880 [Deltaproteobacteria bacterium RIFOXYC2_FULL_48_10]
MQDNGFICFQLGYCLVLNGIQRLWIYLYVKNKIMNDRLGPIVAGILIVIAGTYMYQTGWVNRYQMEVKKPVAILFVLMGIIVVLYGIFHPKKDNSFHYECKKCKKKYKAQWVSDINMNCSICNGKLERKDGVFNV